MREYYIDKLPDVAIFRSGNYGPYLGDVTSAENITAFVVLDSLPAVTVVSSTSALASLMEAASVANPLVIGIFLAENEKAYIEQFYFAAEQLRG